MARCPNCGRETERTIDWACKWCGYPLQSRTFKRIDKTWRQIKEERSGIVSTPEREPEPERRPEPGRYTPEPRQVLKPRPAPEPQRKPERRPAPAPKPRRVEPEPEPEPEEPELVAEAEPEPAPEFESEPALVTEEEEIREAEMSEEEAEAEPEQEQEVVTRPAREQRMAPRPAPAPRPPPAPVQPEPQPSTPSFQTTVEQIRTAYKNDAPGTHEKLKNKVIRVTGIVDKIEVNDVRAIYNVLLTGKQKGDEFRDVECRFARQYGPELGRLTVGETITVDGTYTGYVINIILRQCAMVR